MPLMRESPLCLLCSGATADAALEHIWIMQPQRVAISGTGGDLSFLSGPYKKATGFVIIAINVGNVTRNIFKLLANRMAVKIHHVEIT